MSINQYLISPQLIIAISKGWETAIKESNRYLEYWTYPFIHAPRLKYEGNTYCWLQLTLRILLVEA